MSVGFKPPVSEFLTPDEKSEWAEKRFQFNIVSVTFGDSKYGPAYTYKLARVTEDGEIVTKLISLVQNPRRTEEAEWLMKNLINNDEGIGPCTLGRVETTQGNDAWVFNSAE